MEASADLVTLEQDAAYDEPDERFTGIHEKTIDYLSAGARQVWVVVPSARTIAVFRSDGSARLLQQPETLDGEEVLPGFSLALEELFAI